MKDHTEAAPQNNTYTVGDDKGRLAAAALSLGLRSHRIPKQNVRMLRMVPEVENGSTSMEQPNNNTVSNSLIRGLSSGIMGRVGLLFSDFTYEYASMRSVGVYLEEDEYNEDGRIVISSPSSRKRQTLDLESFMKGDDIQKRNIYRDSSDFSHDPHGGGGGGSIAAAVFGIIKAMVGPAILYLPHGFATSGYAVAILVVLVITAMFLYSSDRLLDAWRYETEKESSVTMSSGYGSLLHQEDASFTTKPKTKSKHISYPELAYRVYGETGEQAVKTGIALMQLGVCLTYFIFVPQNLHSSLRTLYNIDVPMWVCLIFMVLMEIPFSWIRDIRKLTFTNILANFLILYGLCTCIWLALRSDISDTKDMKAIVNKFENLEPIKPGWNFFVGTAVLLFEGSITLCIPLQEAVDTPESRQKFPTIYKKTILSIIIFYCFFAMTCWIAFGDEVQTALTTSLPNGVLATTVQLAYSLAVIFTFPLQAYPAHEIICRSIEPFIPKKSNNTSRPSKNKLTSNHRKIITSSIVILLSFVAIVEMKSLDHVVSLVGALLGCPIAFVFPPLIHNRLVEDPTKWSFGRICNLFVAALGLIGMAFATFTTLSSWNTT